MKKTINKTMQILKIVKKNSGYSRKNIQKIHDKK